LKHEIALERLVESAGMKLTRDGVGLMGLRRPAANRAAGAEISGAAAEARCACARAGTSFFRGLAGGPAQLTAHNDGILVQGVSAGVMLVHLGCGIQPTLTARNSS